MRRFIFTAFILSASFLIVSGIKAGAADAPLKEVAVVEFNRPVKLMDQFLVGRFLFVHDDERMAQGHACAYIYDYSAGQQGKLVVSFHCKPVERAKASRFKVSMERIGPAFDLYEIKEIQFAGSHKGHMIP